MLEGLTDFTRYLAEVGTHYAARTPAEQARGRAITTEVLCEALRHMALTPETRAEVERMVTTVGWCTTSALGPAGDWPAPPSPISGATSASGWDPSAPWAPKSRTSPSSPPSTSP